MGFYYISIFSIVPLAIAYLIVSLVFLGVVALTRGTRGRALILAVSAVVLFALPVSEEFWIAWRFGQACKEAGTVVYKKVEVDGFYDATMRSAWENTKPGRYRFVEEATEDRKAFERVEQVDDEVRDKALAWYAAQNPGQGLPKGKSISYPISDRERIVVFSNGVDARRIIRLDKPTARYHYKTVASHKQVSHQLTEFVDVVEDAETGAEIGRRVDYARGSNWFYLGLSRPTIECPANRGKALLIYREVLFPPSSSK